MTFYDHSTVIKSFIEAADVISVFKEPVNLNQTSLKRQKRQFAAQFAPTLTCFLVLDDGTTFTDIDLFISVVPIQEVEQFCLVYTEDTTISAEVASYLTACQINSPSFPLSGSCQLLADQLG